jgi:hypothetical protein
MGCVPAAHPRQLGILPEQQKNIRTRAMSIPCKFERSILSHDEHGVILRSHHPEIYDSGLDDLKALRQRLRDLRQKERTLARAKRREARGKGPSRGEGFPGTAEHPLQRKQVFAAALKRVNREIQRIHGLAPVSWTGEILGSGYLV